MCRSTNEQDCMSAAERHESPQARETPGLGAAAREASPLIAMGAEDLFEGGPRQVDATKAPVNDPR